MVDRILVRYPTSSDYTRTDTGSELTANKLITESSRLSINMVAARSPPQTDRPCKRNQPCLLRLMGTAGSTPDKKEQMAKFDGEIHRLTEVRREAFLNATGGQRQRRMHVRVSVMARLRTAASVFSGSFAFLGDTAFSDLRQQLQKQHETIGLLSALLFTVAADWTRDSLPDMHSTEPSWVGPLYLVCLWTGCFCLVMCTLTCIFVLMVLSELASNDEARYLTSVARSEFVLALRLGFVGGISTALAIHIWLVIELADLTQLSPDASTVSRKNETSLSLNMTTTVISSMEGPRWAGVILCFLSAVVTTGITFNSAFLLGSKLYHTRHKFCPGRILNDVGAAVASRVSHGITSVDNIHGTALGWFASFDRSEIEAHLDEYLRERGSIANPDDFKHYLLAKATEPHAETLSYFTMCMADKCFQDRLKYALAGKPFVVASPELPSSLSA